MSSQAAMLPRANCVLIAGPTASGKSALAMQKARECGGLIVNADSMQVYDVLRVLTARPSVEDMAQAPHALYGHIDPADHYSTGRWASDVERVMSEAEPDRPLILVGGTGLYFRALTEGISHIPPIAEDIRLHWRTALVDQGAEHLHERLQELDPLAAGQLAPTDGQRVARALEVVEATGKSIVEWQSAPGQPLVDIATAECLVLMPERAELHRRINTRFDQMVATGALEEAAAMMALQLDPALPAAKAIGLRELRAHLAGELSLEEAMERAKAASRQYAKRQLTWFRHQLGSNWRQSVV